jgi:hypothetical protein
MRPADRADTAHIEADARFHLCLVEEDPPRLRREVEQFLATLVDFDAQAARVTRVSRPPPASTQGGPVTDLINLVFGVGSRLPPESRSGTGQCAGGRTC